MKNIFCKALVAAAIAITLLSACKDNAKLKQAVSLKMPSEVAWTFGQVEVLDAEGVLLGSDRHDNSNENFAVTIPWDRKIDGSSLSTKIWGTGSLPTAGKDAEINYQGIWEYNGGQLLKEPLPETVTVDVKSQVKRIAIRLEGLFPADRANPLKARLKLADIEQVQGEFAAERDNQWFLLLPAASDSLLTVVDNNAVKSFAPFFMKESGPGLSAAPAPCAEIRFTTKKNPNNYCEIDLNSLTDGMELVSDNSVPPNPPECADYPLAANTLTLAACQESLSGEQLQALFGDKASQLAVNLAAKICPPGLADLPAWSLPVRITANILGSEIACSYNIELLAAADIPAGTVYRLNKPQRDDVVSEIKKVIPLGGDRYFIIPYDMPAQKRLYELTLANNEMRPIAIDPSGLDNTDHDYGYDGNNFYVIFHQENDYYKTARYALSADGSSFVLDKDFHVTAPWSKEDNIYAANDKWSLQKVLENPLDPENPLLIFIMNNTNVVLCTGDYEKTMNDGLTDNNRDTCITLLPFDPVAPDYSINSGLDAAVVKLTADTISVAFQTYKYVPYYYEETKYLLGRADIKLFAKTECQNPENCPSGYQLVNAAGNLDPEALSLLSFSQDDVNELKLLGAAGTSLYYLSTRDGEDLDGEGTVKLTYIFQHDFAVIDGNSECYVAKSGDFADESRSQPCAGQVIDYNADGFYEPIAVKDGKLTVTTSSNNKLAMYEIGNSAIKNIYNLKKYQLAANILAAYDEVNDRLLLTNDAGLLLALDLAGKISEVQNGLGEIGDVKVIGQDILVATVRHPAWEGDKEFMNKGIIYLLTPNGDKYERQRISPEGVLTLKNKYTNNSHFFTITRDGVEELVIVSYVLDVSGEPQAELWRYDSANRTMVKSDAEVPEFFTYQQIFDGNSDFYFWFNDNQIGYSYSDGDSWETYYLNPDYTRHTLTPSPESYEDYLHIGLNIAPAVDSYLLISRANLDGYYMVGWELPLDFYRNVDSDNQQQFGFSSRLNGFGYRFSDLPDLKTPDLLENYWNEMRQDDADPYERQNSYFIGYMKSMDIPNLINQMLIPAQADRPELLCYSFYDWEYGDSVSCVVKPHEYWQDLKAAIPIEH